MILHAIQLIPLRILFNHPVRKNSGRAFILSFVFASAKARLCSISAEEVSDNDMVLLEQLQTLRAMLVEMRESIGEEEPVEVIAEKSVAQHSADGEQSEPTPKKKRTPRRKLIGEEGVVERPLFPFYEQTLF